MKIWKMRFELDKYNYLVPIEPFTVPEIWAFDGQSLVDTWKPREFRLAKKKRQKLSDAPGFEFLILSPRAYDILCDVMGKSIEVLDVLYNNEKYYGINILSVLDVLDYEKSEYETFENSDRIMAIDKYCFRITEELKQNHIFKIKEEEHYFVSDEFKTTVEKNNLKGFRFQLVWQSDTEKEIEKNTQKENGNTSFYNYVADIDAEMKKEIDKRINSAIKTFHIKCKDDGKHIVEQIYEIVENILQTHSIPKAYNDIQDAAVELGTLYGHAICLTYGWKWMLLGKNAGDASIHVVSDDERYSHMPLVLVYRILLEESMGINGTNDNTILLLFNMIEKLKGKENAGKFYPLN